MSRGAVSNERVLDDQLRRLKHGLELLAEVQVEMALASPKDSSQWERLYQIRFDLGREYYRLKKIAEIKP